MTNSKSHMGFRLTPISMTLDDLHKFEFLSEFLGISLISDAIEVKRMKIGQYCQRQRCRHVDCSNFGRLSRRAGLSAIAELSCSLSAG